MLINSSASFAMRLNCTVEERHLQNYVLAAILKYHCE